MLTEHSNVKFDRCNIDLNHMNGHHKSNLVLMSTFEVLWWVSIISNVKTQLKIYVFLKIESQRMVIEHTAYANNFYSYVRV